MKTFPLVLANDFYFSKIGKLSVIDLHTQETLCAFELQSVEKYQIVSLMPDQN